MEINALKSTTKDARKREKTMRCSSWLQEQHTRGTAETNKSDPEHTNEIA